VHLYYFAFVSCQFRACKLAKTQTSGQLTIHSFRWNRVRCEYATFTRCNKHQWYT